MLFCDHRLKIKIKNQFKNTEKLKYLDFLCLNNYLDIKPTLNMQILFLYIGT